MVGIAYTDHIRRESGRVAKVLAAADLAAAVPTCPDWTVGDLLWHLVEVQWFWGTIALERLDDPQRAEASKPARPGTGAELLRLFAQATERLVEGLSQGGDDTPVWTWSRTRNLGFVRRRQAHEVLVHRLDAELAAGAEVSAMDPQLSADGVDEMLRVMWGGMPDWMTRGEDLDGELVLATTDTGHRWRLSFVRVTGTSPTSGTSYDEPAVVVSDGGTGGEPAASVRAPAAVVDRWLWGRGDTGVDRAGDPTVLARLDELIAEGIT
jgi:uncharacterized protein (TIGR03083 family)